MAAAAVNLVGNWVAAEPQVPCYFIFGDSLVDNGNNNNIQSLARANYLPYGIDFPDGPTGRFSNGRTTVDVVGKLLLPFFGLFNSNLGMHENANYRAN